ncbi:hypothetical protein GCM10017559_05820 [Streptosporangium longisporum]|uniref:Uncharacterized protein n=1 Tax=Streptosporangium longisporum TaxID=46187 RepID=A0ABN3XR09_9ACTN
MARAYAGRVAMSTPPSSERRKRSRRRSVQSVTAWWTFSCSGTSLLAKRESSRAAGPRGPTLSSRNDTRTPGGIGKNGSSAARTTLTISTSRSRARYPARFSTVRIVPPIP